jgi:hypothetical protein
MRGRKTSAFFSHFFGQSKKNESLTRVFNTYFFHPTFDVISYFFAKKEKRRRKIFEIRMKISGFHLVMAAL